ncbi:helix-turn-helix domain-containing protein [Agromyces albus]|uniref:helix-turn-helix domain-containing protein n=1 Tax=Agromyces albus TaxID=205332 RepID=UPI002788FE37|nr:transcriptional regulator with XRE-family HTH domain [Agromyces albus]
MEASGRTQTEVAEYLGVRKSAVSQVMNGSGNVTLDTLAEYLSAMGYEADITAVEQGETLRSMRERRSPRIAAITLRDHDRRSGTNIAVWESRSATKSKELAEPVLWAPLVHEELHNVWTTEIAR